MGQDVEGQEDRVERICDSAGLMRISRRQRNDEHAEAGGYMSFNKIFHL